MKKRKILLTIFPLISGILIYIFFRSKYLFYFRLLKHFSLDKYFLQLRIYAQTFRHFFPTWVVYSFPDGVWIFSFGIALLVNRFYFKKILLFYTFIYLFMIFLEFFQLKFGGHGTFSGTFDKMDVICYTYGYILSTFISFILWKYQMKNSYLKDSFFSTEMKKTLLISIFFIILGFFPSHFKV